MRIKTYAGDVGERDGWTLEQRVLVTADGTEAISTYPREAKSLNLGKRDKRSSIFDPHRIAAHRAFGRATLYLASANIKQSSVQRTFYQPILQPPV